jgi:hypothetical protein
MTLSPLQIPFEQAYRRRALFAVELLDAATLERVYRGITVTAEGLRGKPVPNGGGLFVWLEEDFAPLRKVVVEPGLRPYERAELAAAQVQPQKMNTIELAPRVDYPFPAGLTGLRGTLIERRVQPSQVPTSVVNAQVRLRWLDESGAWHDSPTTSHTNVVGDFAAFLRLIPNEVPQLDPVDRKLSVRLQVSWPGFSDRSSPDFKLIEGRITNPTPDQPQTFAWNELMP